MKGWQKKKTYTKKLFCTKVKDNCFACKSEYLAPKNENTIIYCEDCGCQFTYRWINHRSIKIKGYYQD